MSILLISIFCKLVLAGKNSGLFINMEIFMKEVKQVESSDNSIEPALFSGNLQADNSNAAGLQNLIQGKFKSYEDLELAYKNAQKKLTQAFQKLAEMQKNGNSQQPGSTSDQIDFGADPNYMNSQKQLLLKYLPYSSNKNAKSIQDFVAGLPPYFASQFVADLRELKSAHGQKLMNLDNKKEDFFKQATEQAFKEFEQENHEELGKSFKKIAYEFYKSFGQFTPQQAQAVLEITDKVISAYETEKALNQHLYNENNLAKSKLTSSATLSSAPSADGQHIFTREEIKQMMKTPAGREKFLKVEKLIFDQMAKGLIK